MSNEIQAYKPGASIFSTLESFDHWQRVAIMMAKSSLLPKAYLGNVANTMIAIELAQRIGISPFMVMQNLDIIHGKPSWSSTFIIAALNSCGRFEPVRFVFEGVKGADDYGCRAVTKDKEGLILKGPLVSWGMVKAEGWLDKSGSKWRTMPELMFHYRAASFFGRLYAPDILKGMHSVEEIVDIKKPTAEESETNEEKNRALNFIEKAETIDDLEMIEAGFPDMDQQVQDAYNLKTEQIKVE